MAPSWYCQHQVRTLSVGDDLLVTVIEGTYVKERRDELAAFLRSRRDRVTPQDVGLAPGLRRRTPGLRREEVAQLAGVGVTWYTWLEQGRPINASVQVLDAIARVLRLGTAERWHLYRLADVPGLPASVDTQPLPDEVPQVLDSLDPKPAAVYNGKYDLLACNEAYAAMFPTVAGASGRERNALWQCFGGHRNLLTHCVVAHMVATVRANYARHVGEPEWTTFIADVSSLSDEFAALWATHDVSEPMPSVKTFPCGDVGLVDVRTASFGVTGMPESRMIVYLPNSPVDAGKIEQLRATLRVRRRPQDAAAG
jgi:transcriptional regulator with XRE-family HTH domain